MPEGYGTCCRCGKKCEDSAFICKECFEKETDLDPELQEWEDAFVNEI